MHTYKSASAASFSFLIDYYVSEISVRFSSNKGVDIKELLNGRSCRICFAKICITVEIIESSIFQHINHTEDLKSSSKVNLSAMIRRQSVLRHLK